MLARLERRERDLEVGVARRADVDDVDVVALDRLAPVGGVAVPAELVGGIGCCRLGAADDQAHLRGGRQVEEPVRVAPALRVGGTHERVPDHRDGQGRRG